MRTKFPPILLCLAACTLVPGCGPDGRDPGEIRTDDRVDMGDDSVADMRGARDTREPVDSAGSPDDMVEPADLGSGGQDLASLPFGEICGYDDLVPFSGQCDPVAVSGCAAPDQCLAAVAIMGANAVVSASCADSTINVLGEGEPCQGTTERCAPGLLCISFYGECRKLCYPDTAAGCDPGEFCRRPSASWEGIGFCDSTCNL